MDRFLGQKTVFIGGGRMGEAIFSGLLSNGILKADDLTVLDVYAPRREELEEKYGSTPGTTPRKTCKRPWLRRRCWCLPLRRKWRIPCCARWRPC